MTSGTLTVAEVLVPDRAGLSILGFLSHTIVSTVKQSTEGKKQTKTKNKPKKHPLSRSSADKNLLREVRGQRPDWFELTRQLWFFNF